MNLSRRALLAVATHASLATASSLAGATTLRYRTLDELVAMSEIAILGVPRARVSHWFGGYIVTDHEVEALSVARGALRPGESTVRVRTPGGIVGAVGQSLAGSAWLEPDRMALMLLTSERDGVREVVNLSAGLFPIETSPHAPPRVMPALTAEIEFVGATGGAASLALPPGGALLSEFLPRLRAFRR